MTTTSEIREIAKAVAPGWERWRGRTEEIVTPVREWLLRQLAPQSGDTVLELAAGAGDTGFEAAATAGRLISTDLSPEMVAAARRRGAELGLQNVEYRVMDAEQVELDDGSVDGVLCRFGYMLMADPAAALAETRRVLRPSGRLALAVWGQPERNPWITILAGTLVGGGYLPPPEPADMGPFSLGSEDRLRPLLERAGFSAVLTEEIQVRFGCRDVDDYLRYVGETAGPAAVALQGLSDAERDAIRTKLEAALSPFAVGGGYVLPGLALAAVAS